MCVRLEDGSYLALAQVRGYERVEHGRREQVHGYVTRKGPRMPANAALRRRVAEAGGGHPLPGLQTVLKKAQNLRKIGKLLQPVGDQPRGWIPEDKWLEGQRIWAQRGEAAWNERFLGPHSRWQPDEWRFEKGHMLKPGVLARRGDGVLGYVSNVMGDKELQVHAADHKIYLVDRPTGRQVHPELVVPDNNRPPPTPPPLGNVPHMDVFRGREQGTYYLHGQSGFWIVDTARHKVTLAEPGFAARVLAGHLDFASPADKSRVLRIFDMNKSRAVAQRPERPRGGTVFRKTVPPPPQSHPEWMYSPGLIKLQDELAHGLNGTPDPEQPSQGIQAATVVVDLEDGSKIIDKSGMDTIETQRELMAFVVSEALGAGAPAATEVEDGEIAEEFVPGMMLSAYIDEVLWGDRFRGSEIYTSDRGKLIGLLDKIISNFDRHGGNVIVTGGGQPVPIDHGFATFAAGEQQIQSPFWEYNSNYWRHHLAALRQYRERLAGLKPEFERIRRVSWWDGVMDQIDHLIEDAQGAQG